MNRTRITIALFIALFAAPASAQLLGLGVGTLIPQGDMASGAKTGLAAIASVELGGRIAIRAEALWANSSLKGAFSGTGLPSSTNVSGNVRMLGALGSAVLHLGVGPIQPYVLAGVGYYQRSDAGDVSGAISGATHFSVKESKVGMHFGAGLKLKVLILTAFGEVRYHTVNTPGSKTNFIPVIVGIRL